MFSFCYVQNFESRLLLLLELRFFFCSFVVSDCPPVRSPFLQTRSAGIGFGLCVFFFLLYYNPCMCVSLCSGTVSFLCSSCLCSVEKGGSRPLVSSSGI